ncbi:N-acetylglucosaminyl-diphospho-decaprenol L-rhamnosyltransferase [Rhodovulum iodosum]|uniref:N-acetylglucosaminyl-diphospho-decaprenol L-rhamnosyltransferase n=1 Tax=Rhodovulum iodosum TaxID=68291 RepID=A0ABV3XY00_9RHOB|nr:glycosyltransferase family 2 protein [Rhodovulum robiginosum]
MTESSRNTLDLVVSIINYRTARLTLDCVASVLADIARTPGLAAHVVVVDNASGDGSDAVIADWIAGQGPDLPVTLVRSPTNSGFSGGHNQGIAARAARFYLVLNSDAVLRPGFFAAILAAADAAPAAGLFAPRLEDEDGTGQISCFRFPCPMSELIRGACTGPVTRLLARYDVPLDMPPAADRIGWASFACILLRAEMVAAIGPMDEGYFLYFEDAEYCLRARRAGWSIRYVPEARAVHFRGGSAPVKSLAKARRRLPPYFYASRSRFLRQAHGPAGPVAANLAWHFGRALAQLRVLAGKPRPRAVEAEARDIWINVRHPLGDRRAPEGS